MEKLNEYLQTLLSTCSYELHLEPNKKPYLVSADGENDVAGSPLLGTQISMMVFPLIPATVKQELPTSSEVEFVHPHNLGDFNFNVKKSSAGFNVTIRPLLSENRPANELPESSPPNFEQQYSGAVDLMPSTAVAPNLPISFSNAVAENNFEPPAENSQMPPAFELEESAVNIAEDVPEIQQVETMSVNDPEFMTVFSDTSTYEPPVKKSEFAPMPESISEFETRIEPEPEPNFGYKPEITQAAPTVRFSEDQSMETVFDQTDAPVSQAAIYCTARDRKRFFCRANQPAGKSANRRDVCKNVGNGRVRSASVRFRAADDSYGRQDEKSRKQ